MHPDESRDPDQLAELMGCDPEDVDLQEEDDFPLVEYVKRPRKPLGPEATQFERELDELAAEIERADHEPEEYVADAERRRATLARAERVSDILAAWELEDAYVGIVIGLRAAGEDGYAEIGERIIAAEGVLRTAEVGWVLAEPNGESARVAFNLPPLVDDIGMSESGELLALVGPLAYKFVHLGSRRDPPD
jgi:hypothetical protein